jgi:phosphatidylglycerophosphatase A
MCIVLFIAGTYFTSLYIKETGREDPKEVVIDEVVGQMFTILLSCLASSFVHNSSLSEKLSSDTIDFIFMFVLPFGLFRFFDIVKPWPINWIDKNIKGGIGVMLDDILAAIFAITMCYAITFTIVGNYTNAS